MDLKINDKFVAYKGCIGRREYFLNNLYVTIITSVLGLPFSFWMVTHSQTFVDILNFRKLFAEAPIFASFFYGFSCAVAAAIIFGLVARRLSDIFGIETNTRIYVFAGIVTLIPYLWALYMNPLTALLLIINFIFALVLLFTPGKVTGKIPHVAIKRFNWGAFWGTWIWGLFNKVYITLWTIPLFFTPAGFCASLICGMKGNEWAFEKSKTDDIEEFQNGQRNQAIVWNVLAGFLILILPALIFFLLIGFMVSSAIKNPDAVDKFMNKTESLVEMIIDEGFEEYKLDVNENRFYVDPQDWINMSFDERYNLLKSASSFASMKKRNSQEPKFEGYNGSRTTEMEITKIYSSYNGEILGEFRINLDDVKDFKSAFKSIMNSVRFNTNPELPPPLPQE